MVAVIHTFTVAEYGQRGALGLAIPSCRDCSMPTELSWQYMGARDDEHILDLAGRVLRCGHCGTVPDDGEWGLYMAEPRMLGR